MRGHLLPKMTCLCRNLQFKHTQAFFFCHRAHTNLHICSECSCLENANQAGTFSAVCVKLLVARAYHIDSALSSIAQVTTTSCAASCTRRRVLRSSRARMTTALASGTGRRRLTEEGAQALGVFVEKVTREEQKNRCAKCLRLDQQQNRI